MTVFLAERGGQTAAEALDKGGFPPHMAALRERRLRIVKHLVRKFEIDLNRVYSQKCGQAILMTNTALIKVCAVDDVLPDDIMPLLFYAGADLDAKNEKGESALHILASSSLSTNTQAAKVLLEYGADVNLSNNDGRTALHVVCDNIDRKDHVIFEANFEAKVPFFKLLLDYGVDVNVPDKQGNTALLLTVRGWHCDDGATTSSRPTIVHRLLESGANLHHTNQYGNNALSTAAVFPFPGAREVCQFLLDLDDLVLSTQGAQAVLAACVANNPEIVRLLVQALLEQGIFTADGATSIDFGCDDGDQTDDTAWWDREGCWTFPHANFLSGMMQCCLPLSTTS